MKVNMRAILAGSVIGLMAVGGAPANAKGCLKGAAVGGVAGHMAGHGVLGAVGGCAVGHHMANKADKNSMEQQSRQQGSAGYDQTRQ